MVKEDPTWWRQEVGALRREKERLNHRSLGQRIKGPRVRQGEGAWRVTFRF